MSESTRMLLGLALGIIVMILLVMKTKVHSFMALLIAAMITGIIGGMPVSDVTLADGTTQTGLITAIQEGFGSTLKSTGIIIGLGVMMGGILEKSGAAEKMAYSFIKVIGQKNEEWHWRSQDGLFPFRYLQILQLLFLHLFVKRCQE